MPRTGRPKQFSEVIYVRVPAGTQARINAVLAQGETHSEFGRRAIEALLRASESTRQEAAASGAIETKPNGWK